MSNGLCLSPSDQSKMTLLPVLLLLFVGTQHKGGCLQHGDKVSQSKVAYTVQVYSEKYFLAAGAIISARFIITVAHCFLPAMRGLSVVAGQALITSKNNITVLRIYMHHQFSPKTLINDVAVLFLREEIKSSKSISYIALCSRPLHLRKMLVAGWSIVNKTEPLTSIQVMVESREQCLQRYRQLPAGIVCAKAYKPGGLCYGDSGDPMMDGDELCGLAVAFRKCNDRRRIGLYTDIHYHRPFIARAIRELEMGKEKRLTR